MKKVFVLLFFVSFLFGLFSDDYIYVYFKQVDNLQYDFYAENSNYCPYQLKISLKNDLKLIDNAADLPFTTVIEPRKKAYLFSVWTKNKINDFDFDISATMGDPNKVSLDENYKYILPYKEGTEFRLTQGYSGRYSHNGWTKYSLDFGMEVGTPVCAARDGIVVDVKDDSDLGGKSSKFSRYANYIRIYHSDGSFSQYMHLEKNGAVVKVGDVVKNGDVIGYSGNTGWSKGPHLHFMVFKPTTFKYMTISTKFLQSNNVFAEISTRKYYASYRIKENTIVNNDKKDKKNLKDTESETNLGGF